MHQILQTYYKHSFNLMTLSIMFIVIFPSYIENFGYKYAFLTISISYGLSRLQWFCSGEDIQKWGLHSWLKLLGLIARLGLTCSSLGRLLISYQGSENAAFHLFPRIPWVMPITVPLALTIFIILGLQPSSIIKVVFDCSFGSLLASFLAIGLYQVYSESSTLNLEVSSIYEVPAGMLFFLSQFTIQTNGKKVLKNNQHSIQFWLCMLVMGILAFLNEKTKCNGLGDCLKHFYEWYEPIHLALSVACLGLCLTDFFMATSELLQTITEFEELHATLFKKLTLNSAVFVGVSCMSLVYFYTSTMLVIVCNSSILIALSLENLQNICLSISSSTYRQRNNTSENRYSKLNQSDQLELSMSDEDSCSDIDALVDEYRSQVQVVSGQTLATEIYLKRASYIFKLILTTVAVCSLLMSLAFQSKLYKFGFSMTAAILILMLLLQWAINTVNSMLLKPRTSLYFPLGLYAIHIFLIGFIPSSVWVYILIWTLQGAALKIALISIKKLNGKREFQHFFSIRETPPVFGTAQVEEPKETKSKIIHA